MTLMEYGLQLKKFDFRTFPVKIPSFPFRDNVFSVNFKTEP